MCLYRDTARAPSAPGIALVWWVLALSAPLWVAPGILAAGVGDANAQVRRVVILNATDPYLPAFLAFDDAQRKTINEESRFPVEYFAETLDMHRFAQKLFKEDEVALLRKKYRDLKVDAVSAAAPIALRMMEPEVESRGCRIQCQPADDLPPVLADSLQVQLVLTNLLRNAMHSVCAGEEYDRRLTIEVGLTGQGQVQISVTDRGGGVPPDLVADIFEPLYTGASGGMGMGLAISRAIVDAHGGRIWFEPNPGGGAIFRFTLRVVEA